MISILWLIVCFLNGLGLHCMGYSVTDGYYWYETAIFCAAFVIGREYESKGDKTC